ncbi:hypothetical protein H4R18_004875 [Coemansia javaensis]|uniref:superoxide dismutase n=1 Tax=Coemansia javaensis TaxID=2761396 RepID=A0A9W8H6N5_9FUNG|nr:hypothetical protein H4R18_004875 [Coemansia javaensis]
MDQRIGAAGLHQRATLPYVAKKGLAPFLSGQALEFLYDGRQSELLDNVNRLTGGTENEGKGLVSVIYSAVEDPSQGALLNYASQAWCMDFFLQSLTDQPRPPGESVRRTIAEQFGSFERFKDTFSQHALGLFGSGWTWLVQNESGQLSVINTFNGTSPLTALRSNPYTKARGVSYSNISRRTDTRPFVRLAPILGLNMWQEAYVPDYGINKDAYVQRFWEVVNWSAVDERLMSAGRSPRM